MPSNSLVDHMRGQTWHRSNGQRLMRNQDEMLENQQHIDDEGTHQK